MKINGNWYISVKGTAKAYEKQSKNTIRYHIENNFDEIFKGHIFGERKELQGSPKNLDLLSELDNLRKYKKLWLDKFSFYKIGTLLNSSPITEPLQFVISENLRRRHLEIAQRVEIGLLIEKEEAIKAKERKALINAEIGKAVGKGIGKSEPLTKPKKLDLAKKIDEIKEELGEGRAMDIAAEKVKVSHETLRKGKIIKKTANGYKDKKGIEHPSEPIIAKEWEKAKKGGMGIKPVGDFPFSGKVK